MFSKADFSMKGDFNVLKYGFQAVLTYWLRLGALKLLYLSYSICQKSILYCIIFWNLLQYGISTTSGRQYQYNIRAIVTEHYTHVTIKELRETIQILP